MIRHVEPRILVVVLLCHVGCSGRSLPATDGGRRAHVQELPQDARRSVDILFVVDNTMTSAEEQEILAQGFPALIDGLRGPGLAQEIPDLHIGLITTDLGIGPYSVMPCETVGGDRGRLQSRARYSSCPAPDDPYIAYADGATNVAPGAADPIERVNEAFKCISFLGTDGCWYEQPLEAARKALAGCGPPGYACTTNPGFVRRDALLAIVIVTNDDDCSAARTELFDPSGADDPNNPLGPFSEFRCFRFGIECDGDDPLALGPRQGCRPGFDWLVPVETYAGFLKGLKPPGRVLIQAITGPTDVVAVAWEPLLDQPILRHGCWSGVARANPAIRLETLLRAFGSQGLFNVGGDLTAAQTQTQTVTLCDKDYRPALQRLGQTIAATLRVQCLGAPPLTESGALACDRGAEPGPGAVCSESCLDRADCVVQEVRAKGTPAEETVDVPRCAAEAFADPQNTSCGERCPCWRLVRDRGCEGLTHGSPYALEILRTAPPPAGTVARVPCTVAGEAWGTPSLAALPQCR